MKRISNVITAMVLFILSAALVLYFTGYMPGTVRRDTRGFVRGTGRLFYHYESGPVMLEEHYLAGRLRLSRWFRPDGSLVAETRWQQGNGVGYYLRQDGTVRVKMEFREGRAHGIAVYFNEDGETVDHVTEFRDGVKIEKTD